MIVLQGPSDIVRRSTSPFSSALHFTVQFGTKLHRSVRHETSPFSSARGFTVPPGVGLQLYLQAPCVHSPGTVPVIQFGTPLHRSVQHEASPFSSARGFTVPPGRICESYLQGVSMSGPLSPLSGPLSRLCMCVLSIFSEDQVFHPGATQEMYLQVPRLPRNFALFPPRIYHTSVQVIKCFINTTTVNTNTNPQSN